MILQIDILMILQIDILYILNRCSLKSNNLSLVLPVTSADFPVFGFQLGPHVAGCGRQGRNKREKPGVQMFRIRHDGHSRRRQQVHTASQQHGDARS